MFNVKGTVQGNTSIVSPQRNPWQAVSFPDQCVMIDASGKRVSVDLRETVSQQDAEAIRQKILRQVDRTYIHPMLGSRDDNGQPSLPAPVA